MELNHIALPGNPEGQRAHGQAAGDPHAGPRFVRSVVGFLMQHPALGGEAVLRPGLLQMNERALPRTVEPMLKGGKRQEFCFGKHGERW